jgi:hypothetical protein
MVKSCTGWNRLSVNCSSRHDLPTPAGNIHSSCKHHPSVPRFACTAVGREPAASASCTGELAAGETGTAVAIAAAHLPVSPMMMYLKRYLHALMHVSLTEARGVTTPGDAAALRSLRVAHDAARPSCQRHCCCCLGLVGRYGQRALVFTALKSV